VSTVEQNADLQTRALTKVGCLKVYTDHGVSGTKAKRPQLDKLLEHARAGDELVAWKLDRLGRNTRQLLEVIDHLESQDIHFRSLTEGIATTGPMGKAMLTVMSAFAQLERDQLAERTKAGMAAAAARGRKGGRPAVTPETEKVRQASQYRHAGLTPPEIAKLLGISRATVYRYLTLATNNGTS
jgi:DNA invertase Pin-like site-specific DNA recombinase